jgi:UrcA family protein
MNRLSEINIRPAVLAAVVLGLPTTAAATGRDVRIVAPRNADREEVRFSDLDLARKADQAKLKRRIILAAERVCLFQGYVDIACRDATSADGWAQAQRAMNQHSDSSIAGAVTVVAH